MALKSWWDLKLIEAGLTVAPLFDISLANNLIHAEPTVTPVLSGMVNYAPRHANPTATVTPVLAGSLHKTTHISAAATVTPSLHAVGSVTIPNITFDTANAGVINTSASGSYSMTATAGAAVLVAFAVQNAGTGQHGSWTRSVTYGGTAMTSLGVVDFDNLNNGWVELFGLLSVPGGAQTIAYSTNASVHHTAVCSASYLHVNSFGTAVTNEGKSSTLSSGSITSAGTKMVVQTFFIQGGGGLTMSGYNHTLREHLTATDAGLELEGMLGDVAGAPTVSFSASVNGSADYGSVAVPLN